MAVAEKFKVDRDEAAERTIKDMYANQAEIRRLTLLVDTIEQEKQDIIFAKDDEISELTREIETLQQFRREDAAALEKMDERLRKENAHNVQLVSLFDIFENEIRRVKGSVHAADLMKMGQLPERRPAGAEMNPEESLAAFKSLGKTLGVNVDTILRERQTEEVFDKDEGLVKSLLSVFQRRRSSVEPAPPGRDYVSEITREDQPLEEAPVEAESTERPPMMQSVTEDLAASSLAEPVADQPSKEPAEVKP
jgi:hypothetical protein